MAKKKTTKKKAGASSSDQPASNGSAPAESINIDDILRGKAHALTIFKPKTIAGLSIFLKRGKPYLTCYASGKERPAKPEEIVRQLYIKMLMDDYGYPAERIAIEKPVQMGSNVHDKPADIVTWDKDEASINARREARRLLDEAKTMVEQAILGDGV